MCVNSVNCNQFGFVNIYHRAPHPKRMFKINEPIHRVETYTSHHTGRRAKKRRRSTVSLAVRGPVFCGIQVHIRGSGSVALRRSTGARSES